MLADEAQSTRRRWRWIGNAGGVGFAPAVVALDPSLRSACTKPRSPVAVLSGNETPTGKVRIVQRLAPSNVWPDFSFHLPEARRCAARAVPAASGHFYSGAGSSSDLRGCFLLSVPREFSTNVSLYNGMYR